MRTRPFRYPIDCFTAASTKPVWRNGFDQGDPMIRETE